VPGGVPIIAVPDAIAKALAGVPVGAGDHKNE
jgi:hypothetical protein